MAAAAESISRFVTFFRRKSACRVLDYGAGNLRNACFLAEQGFQVYAADLPDQVARIMRLTVCDKMSGILESGALDQSSLAVDVVVSTYVLNIIPDLAEKHRYFKNIVINLRPHGYLLIEARCRVESERCGSGCSLHLKCPSCIKTYSHDELDSLAVPYGFRRISHYYRQHALVVLYQLGNA